MPKMSDADLRSLIRSRRQASDRTWQDGQARDRKQALEFYRGDNDTVYGDSGDGLSTVVSRDVFESIESVLPGLIKPFVAGDESVRFEPTGPEDEEPANQATEYVNYRFQTDNNAFRVVYDFAKDGMLSRLGVAKVVREMHTDNAVEHYEGITEAGLAAIDAADDVEIVGDVMDAGDGTFAVKVMRTIDRPRYRVHIVAPDEFQHDDRLASLDEATFLAHRKRATVGDLIAMGLPKQKCMDLGSGDGDSMERDDRFEGEDWHEENLDQDDLARKVWVAECYVRCDYDGTGALTWRKVIVGGNDDTVLAQEEVEDHPFVVWTPIPMPHKMVGLSFYDITQDVQKQMTAILRESLNALYLSNRPMREVVEGQVNIEDLLNPSVGGLARVKQPGMIRDIASGGEGVMQASLAMIEHLSGVREARTGSTRYNQGMDANSLNKTATGISIIQNASTQRQEMIARQLAEGIKGIFKKLLGLVCRYQDKAEVIRLRGKWVEMDPRAWKNNYDMSVTVGLGTGNKEQEAAHLRNLMEIQKEIALAQGGTDGPLVTWTNIYETAKRLTENLGLKGVERYFQDPADKPEGEDQPQEPGEMAQQQAAMEAEAMKVQAELANKVTIERMKAEADIEIARIKAAADIEIAAMTSPQPVMVPDGAYIDPQGGF